MNIVIVICAVVTLMSAAGMVLTYQRGVREGERRERDTQMLWFARVMRRVDTPVSGALYRAAQEVEAEDAGGEVSRAAFV